MGLDERSAVDEEFVHSEFLDGDRRSYDGTNELEDETGVASIGSEVFAKDDDELMGESEREEEEERRRSACFEFESSLLVMDGGGLLQGLHTKKMTAGQLSNFSGGGTEETPSSLELTSLLRLPQAHEFPYAHRPRLVAASRQDSLLLDSNGFPNERRVSKSFASDVLEEKKKRKSRVSLVKWWRGEDDEQSSQSCRDPER